MYALHIPWQALQRCDMLHHQSHFMTYPLCMGQDTTLYTHNVNDDALFLTLHLGKQKCDSCGLTHQSNQRL